MKLTGLVDLDPAKLGKSLDQLSGNGSSARSGPKVVGSIGAIKIKKPAVAIVTTASHFDRVGPTLRECITRGIHVVSSCEEMSFPAYRHPAAVKSRRWKHSGSYVGAADRARK